MKKNRRISLSIKIYNLIILLVFCSALFSIVVSYREHVKTTDEIYEALSSNIAETVSNSLNGTRVRTLVNTCTDSEYQKLLARAREENNSDLIKEYLLDKDLLLTYENIKELLRQFTQYMDVQHIFIEFIGDGELYHIVNPADDYLSFGYREDLYGIYLPYSGQNVSIPPMISRFSDNLVCTCFEPVFDSEGNPVAVVGVELDMRSLIREHRRFGLIIIISALALAALAATLGVFFMRRSVTDPLEKLCSQTRDFSDKQEQYSQSDIINLNIHSGDEIEDLYEAIQSMEEKIVRYLDHLIKVTGEEEHARTELNIAAQIQRDIFQFDLSVFNPAHLQNIIDEREKNHCGCLRKRNSRSSVHGDRQIPPQDEGFLRRITFQSHIQTQRSDLQSEHDRNVRFCLDRES